MSENQHLMPEVLRGGESVYHLMSQLALKHGAADLAQGFPSIDGPADVIEHAAQALRTGYQQYTDPRGPLSLRRALAHDAKRRFDRDLDVDAQIVVTAGAQEALGAALLGLLEKGDEVIFIEPFYNPCIPVARLSGATLKFVSLQGPDFHLDEALLLEAMSERTKLVVYNSPNNPSGHVFTSAELQILARACERFDAYVLADEVYEHLVFGSHKHTSALQIPELRDRAVVVSSFSKTFLMTGWRVGWALGAAPLVAGINRVHQLMSFCLPSFTCEGARFALEELPESYLVDYVATHERKRDFLCKGLSEAGLSMRVPEGTFFCAIDISDLDEDDDISLCKKLPEEAGVAAVPMSLSWHERSHGRNLIRLCFSKDDQTLERAVAAFATWAQHR